MPCANTTTYADRLTNHINTYINLVTDNPSVRFNEFAQLASYADLKNPKNMIEVPAEGKLLELFYPNVNIHRADFLKINTADYGDSVLLTDWTLANIKPNFYDAVVSLAPIHHANKDQKKQYVKGAFKALKTNGILAFGEVELASKLHIFLDEFINSYSATGHVGQYPNAEFNQVIEAQGFKQVSSECRNCNWQFESAELLYAYMTKLFALKPLPMTFLLEAINTYLGISEIEGKFSVNWALRYYRGVKLTTE